MRQAGGMIAFELQGGLQAGVAFMDALKLVTLAVSLGDAESLAQHPATMTHSTYTPEERAAHGISDGLVRLSVGLEDIEDLLADIAQALDSALAISPTHRHAPARHAPSVEALSCSEPA
jgi:methionine-gamma-lyase